MKSSKYWQLRALQRQVRSERNARVFERQMFEAWLRADQLLMNDIDVIVRRFGWNYDMTSAETLSLLSEPITRAEQNQLMLQAMQIEDEWTRNRMMARVSAPAYQARISRLQALREQANYRYARIAPGQVKLIETSLKETAVESYYRTIFDKQKGTGLAFEFAALTDKDIREVTDHRWHGGNWQDSVWQNTDLLAERVPKVLQDNLSTGRSWRRSMDAISDISIESGQYTSARLLRTETAYVHNEITAKALEESGTEYYKLIATLDGRTSDICQSMDGKRFPVKDRSVGTNYPPLHPHCRTTAVEDDIRLEGLQRRARDPITGETYLVPAEMTYKEWRESLVTEHGKEVIEAGEKKQRLRARIG